MPRRLQLPVSSFQFPNLRRVLSLKVARFAAVATIILTVFGEAQFDIRVAKGAVTVTSALAFRLVTDHAFELFGEHEVGLLSAPVNYKLSIVNYESHFCQSFGAASVSSSVEKRLNTEFTEILLRDLCVES